jgi:hypothetical protein
MLKFNKTLRLKAHIEYKYVTFILHELRDYILNDMVENASSYVTKNGHTQISKAKYMAKVENFLNHKKVDFKKIPSNKPGDLYFNTKTLGKFIIDFKKTCGATIMFNDTPPQRDFTYFILINRPHVKNVVLISGCVLLKNQNEKKLDECFEYLDLGREKFHHLGNELKSYFRPSFSYDISKYCV